jgi:hypothetical protein
MRSLVDPLRCQTARFAGWPAEMLASPILSGPRGSQLEDVNDGTGCAGVGFGLLCAFGWDQTGQWGFKSDRRWGPVHLMNSSVHA